MGTDLLVKLSRANSKSGEFVWIGNTPELLEAKQGGTGCTRFCEGDDDHNCDVEGDDFWFEVVEDESAPKDEDSGRKPTVKRPCWVSMTDAAAFCAGKDGCVERTFIEKILDCNRKFDEKPEPVLDDKGQQALDPKTGEPLVEMTHVAHVHDVDPSHLCPRRINVPEELGPAIEQWAKLVAKQADEVDLVGQISDAHREDQQK